MLAALVMPAAGVHDTEDHLYETQHGRTHVTFKREAKNCVDHDDQEQLPVEQRRELDLSLIHI